MEVFDLPDNVAHDDGPFVQRVGWLYAFFRWDGECVYVGETLELPTRMAQHTADTTSRRWRLASQLGKQPDLVAAWQVGEERLRLEKSMILLMQPSTNSKGLR